MNTLQFVNIGLGRTVEDGVAVVKLSANHSTRYGQSDISVRAFLDVTKSPDDEP